MQVFLQNLRAGELGSKCGTPSGCGGCGAGTWRRLHQRKVDCTRNCDYVFTIENMTRLDWLRGVRWCWLSVRCVIYDLRLDRDVSVLVAQGHCVIDIVE